MKFGRHQISAGAELYNNADCAARYLTVPPQLICPASSVPKLEANQYSHDLTPLLYASYRVRVQHWSIAAGTALIFPAKQRPR
jgi:hypothetical protein